MKELLFVIINIFTLLTIVNGQGAAAKDSLAPDHNKTLLYKSQVEAFLFNPGELGNWNNGDFSVITVNGSFTGGGFKRVDEFDNDEQYSFYSRSVQTFKDTGWRFYGDFSLSVSNHHNADWNLGFEKSALGNPFWLVTPRAGDFNVKRYGLTGIMNKKLGSRVAISLAVKYNGDLYFRLRDTRNEFYNLTAELPVALNFSLTETKDVTLGVSWFYKKGSPLFSNEYLANTPEYYLYFNKGLGDFMKIELSNTYYLRNSNPIFFAGYSSGKENRFTVAWSAFLGNEYWDNKITSTLAVTPKELFRYRYFNNELLSTYTIKKDNYTLANKLLANFVYGTGYENGVVLQKTYEYHNLKVNGTSELARPGHDLFYYSWLTVEFEQTGKRDMIYAQELVFSNISVKAKTGYSLPLNNSNNITFNGDGYYRYNISFLHDVVAAGTKPYTLNLAYNEVAYNSAGLCNLGGEIEWLRRSGKNLYELSFSFNYLFPTQLKFQNEYSGLTVNDARHFMKTSLNIYF